MKDVKRREKDSATKQADKAAEKPKTGKPVRKVRVGKGSCGICN